MVINRYEINQSNAISATTTTVTAATTAKITFRLPVVRGPHLKTSATTST